jgi:P22_AR N-terminal domain
MEDEEEYQPGVEEVHTWLFYGKPLVAVRLSDGRPAVSIRSLCSNMELDRKAQVRRIKRTAPIAGDLVENVVIDLQTGGGPQPSQVLVLRSLAYWLTGIDHKRTRPEMQDEILKYQCEAVDALYMWAGGQRTRALPAPEGPQVIEAPGSSTAIVEQTRADSTILAPIDEPGPGASVRERAAYHERMSVWHRYQADLHAQAWRADVEARIEDQEARLESREAVVQLIPEILDRLGPEKINGEQQTSIRGMVKRLVELSGTPYQTVYWELAQAFHAPRYDEIGASQYPVCVSGLSGVWRPPNDPAECVILARRLYCHPDNPKSVFKALLVQKEVSVRTDTSSLQQL